MTDKIIKSGDDKKNMKKSKFTLEDRYLKIFVIQKLLILTDVPERFI